jgi:hypothetical protein
LAKYKKKRARQLKHDRFRDATMLLADRLAERVAGRGRQILYGLGAVVIIALAGYGVYRWQQRHTQEAERALGRGINIMSAQVSASPAPGATAGDLTFTSESERAQKAIDLFQQVAAKYGDPYRSEARYFVATNLLVTDRPKGLSELQALGQGSGDVAVLAKFALAQAKESDGSYDEAAALYSEIAKTNSTIVTLETANLRLGAVYGKQGKKKEAGDLLFGIIDAARKAKDKDGKPVAEPAASRDAAQELKKIDPARYAQLPPPPSMGGLSF